MYSGKTAVGYVRSMKGYIKNCDFQKKIIRRYARSIGLCISDIYEDNGSVLRTRTDNTRAYQLGLTVKSWLRSFPAWEEMLLKVKSDEIQIIVVDCQERLYSNAEEKILFEALIQEHGVLVLEVENIDEPEEASEKKVVIYYVYSHYNKLNDIRPGNATNDIDAFYDEIERHKDWKFSGLYIDNSIDRRVKLPILMERDNLDIILCKYFYQIKRRPGVFLERMQELNQKGIQLISTEEGIFHFDPSFYALVGKKLRIATYDCYRTLYGYSTRDTTRKKLDMFCSAVLGNQSEIVHYEEYTRTVSSEFERLIQEVGAYDVLVIDTVTKLGRSINELMHCLKRLGIPIYSLKEGLVYVDEWKA